MLKSALAHIPKKPRKHVPMIAHRQSTFLKERTCSFPKLYLAPKNLELAVSHVVIKNKRTDFPFKLSFEWRVYNKALQQSLLWSKCLWRQRRRKKRESKGACLCILFKSKIVIASETLLRIRLC